MAAEQRGRGHSRALLGACRALAAAVARPWRADTASDTLFFLELNDPFRLTPEQYRLDSAHAGIDRFEPLLEHALECIRDFRLVTFEQVHKHYSFNVFRYETEQTFFATIEAVRGFVQRRAYWDQVLQHLTETINGLQQDRASQFQRRIGLLGVVLAATGVVQTWFAVFPLPTEREPAWLFLLGTLLLPVAALVLWLRHRRELVPKTIRPSSKAWRASRATASGPLGTP